MLKCDIKLSHTESYKIQEKVIVCLENKRTFILRKLSAR